MRDLTWVQKKRITAESQRPRGHELSGPYEKRKATNTGPSKLRVNMKPMLLEASGQNDYAQDSQTRPTVPMPINSTLGDM